MHTPTQEKDKIPTKPVAFLIYAISKYKNLFLLALFVVFLASLIGQSLNYFFKLIVDASESGDIDKVIMYALMYPVAVFVVQLFYRTSGFLGGSLTTSIKKNVNDELMQYVMNHSHMYFSNRFAGSLLTKTRNVVSAIDQFIPDLLWTHIPALVGFIFTATIIFSADILSGVLFILLVATLIGVNRIFAREKKRLSYVASQASTKLSGAVVDVLTNMGAVRQYVQTNFEYNKISNLSSLWRSAVKANWHYTEKMLTINSVIIFVFSMPIFYYLVMRWNNGYITTGFFVFIIALYAQMLHTLLFIGRAFNHAARAFGEMEEGLTDILKPYDITDSPSAKKLVVVGGTIEWQNVRFVYDDNQDEIVFNDFNLTIKAGQRIGLVGTSGAGKSTFVSLLLRQHDVNAGEICIDGQNIAEVTQDSLREHIAVVPQEPMLFHRSIRDNIAYGKPTASDDEIIEVAQKAQAHDFISALPQGYDTLVGERGVKLSGGQKQRIAIARAMLKNAPILVLDEATSALDSESEVAIQKALHELMEKKTVIAIAHRLSTLREMDRILVLEKGAIVEDGTHAKLLKKKGVYSALWKHQAGGFLTE